MSSRWREFRGGHRPKPQLRPNTCHLCRAPVIWARIRGPSRSGRRAYLPFPVERCPPGTAGNIALTAGLFLDGQAPLAEEVSVATAYRSHRDNCPALPPKPKQATPATPATPPRSFSAQSFTTKKRSGGSR